MQSRPWVVGALGLLLLALSIPTEAASQGGPPVSVGERVRVTSELLADGRIVGTVVRVDADAVVVRDSSATAPTSVPVPAITRLEISAGERSRWLRGMGIGFLAGAVVGAVYGGVNAGTGSGEIDLPTEHAMGLGALFVGAGGAMVGAIVGATMRAERWEPLERGSLTVRLGRPGASRDGLTLALHLHGLR